MIIWTENGEKHWQKRYGKKNTKKAYTEAYFCYSPVEFSTNVDSLYYCFLQRDWIFNLKNRVTNEKNKVMRWKFIKNKAENGFSLDDVSHMLNLKPTSLDDWIRKNKNFIKELGAIVWKK